MWSAKQNHWQTVHHTSAHLIHPAEQQLQHTGIALRHAFRMHGEAVLQCPSLVPHLKACSSLKGAVIIMKMSELH